MIVDDSMQHEHIHSIERQLHKFDTVIMAMGKELEHLKKEVKDMRKLLQQHSLYIDNMQNTHDDVDQVPRELLRSNNTGGGA